MANKISFNENNRNGFNKCAATVINTLQNAFGIMTRAAVVTALIAVASSAPMAGQVKFGVKGGITTTELKDKESIMNNEYHIAYTGGLTLDLNIPKVNLGLEVSALYRYSHESKVSMKDVASKRHCIDIPVYARYRLAIPGVEKAVAPVVFTGPNLSLVFSDKKLMAAGEDKTRLSWDVGAGVDLFRHMRLTASYGIGMKKAMNVVGKEYSGNAVKGKDNCWTISASYLF